MHLNFKSQFLKNTTLQVVFIKKLNVKYFVRKICPGHVPVQGNCALSVLWQIKSLLPMVHMLVSVSRAKMLM